MPVVLVGTGARWACLPPCTCAGAGPARPSCSTAPGAGHAAGGQVRRTGTPARPALLSALAGELAAADVLVACTGAIGTVVPRDVVAAVK